MSTATVGGRRRQRALAAAQSNTISTPSVTKASDSSASVTKSQPKPSINPFSIPLSGIFSGRVRVAVPRSAPPENAPTNPSVIRSAAIPSTGSVRGSSQLETKSQPNQQQQPTQAPNAGPNLSSVQTRLPVQAQKQLPVQVQRALQRRGQTLPAPVIQGRRGRDRRHGNIQAPLSLFEEPPKSQPSQQQPAHESQPPALNTKQLLPTVNYEEKYPITNELKLPNQQDPRPPSETQAQSPPEKQPNVSTTVVDSLKIEFDVHATSQLWKQRILNGDIKLDYVPKLCDAFNDVESKAYLHEIKTLNEKWGQDTAIHAALNNLGGAYYKDNRILDPDVSDTINWARLFMWLIARCTSSRFTLAKRHCSPQDNQASDVSDQALLQESLRDINGTCLQGATHRLLQLAWMLDDCEKMSGCSEQTKVVTDESQNAQHAQEIVTSENSENKAPETK